MTDDDGGFVIKRGDLEPPLRFTLYDGTAPANLASAASVRVICSRRGALRWVDTDPDLSDAALGVVVHRWQAGQTDERGTFQTEVEVTWPGARPQTFPAAGYLDFRVDDDLA